MRGEAGIGKSSLVEAIATELRDTGYVVLRAACYAFGQVFLGRLNSVGLHRIIDLAA